MSSSSVSMDHDKIRAVVDWHVPKTLKDLRGFLGLTRYYRRFVRSYASIAAPLTDLLKKDSFMWDSKAQSAFEQLKLSSSVSMDQDKIRAVVGWPVPKTLKDLRGFLGLTWYYRRFVRSYASIAAALTDLLKKDSFVWDSKAQSTFEQLKLTMTSVPVLILPNFSEDFVLETDASDVGVSVGVVLLQRKHPMSYFSKKLSLRMQTTSAYVQELYAITETVTKWRQYLLGRRFIIRTYQKSLRALLDQIIHTPEQQHYLTK